MENMFPELNPEILFHIIQRFLLLDLGNDLELWLCYDFNDKFINCLFGITTVQLNVFLVVLLQL